MWESNDTNPSIWPHSWRSRKCNGGCTQNQKNQKKSDGASVQINQSDKLRSLVFCAASAGALAGSSLVMMFA